jgi:GNAT superfamily N-acetyltransferase
MPTGPFNLPRVTNISPFTDTEASQEFIREVTTDEINGPFLSREVTAIHGIDTGNASYVDAKLVVREDINDDPDNLIERVESGIQSIDRETEVAYMEYWIKDNISYIMQVYVKEDFRNMQIATTLKRGEIEHMKEEGVDIVYTDVISNGGYRLAVKTQFEPIYNADHLLGTESTLTFKNNKGTMFRYL